MGGQRADGAPENRAPEDTTPEGEEGRPDPEGEATVRLPELSPVPRTGKLDQVPISEIPSHGARDVGIGWDPKISNF